LAFPDREALSEKRAAAILRVLAPLLAGSAGAARVPVAAAQSQVARTAALRQAVAPRGALRRVALLASAALRLVALPKAAPVAL